MAGARGCAPDSRQYYVFTNLNQMSTGMFRNKSGWVRQMGRAISALYHTVTGPRNICWMLNVISFKIRLFCCKHLFACYSCRQGRVQFLEPTDCHTSAETILRPPFEGTLEFIAKWVSTVYFQWLQMPFALLTQRLLYAYWARFSRC